jgi:hypothetical protein
MLAMMVGMQSVCSHASKFAKTIISRLANQLLAIAIDNAGETPTQSSAQWVHVQREPKHEITDPSIFEKGGVSHGRIKATPGEREALDAGSC